MKQPRQNTGNHPDPLGDVFTQRDNLLRAAKAVLSEFGQRDWDDRLLAPQPNELMRALQVAVAQAEAEAACAVDDVVSWDEVATASFAHVLGEDDDEYMEVQRSGGLLP